MRWFLSLLVMLLAHLLPASVYADEVSADRSEYRAWIIEMQGLERGPFSRLRWFCTDGTVLPPKSYACKDHGGGYQHGEWSEKTLELAAAGLPGGQCAGGPGCEALVDDPGFRNLYAQILIERFLVSADDGWILRRALFYRGAIQEEDERAAARTFCWKWSRVTTGSGLVFRHCGQASGCCRMAPTALRFRKCGRCPLRCPIRMTGSNRCGPRFTDLPVPKMPPASANTPRV